MLRLSLTDDYLLYVKSSMRPWLIISGLLLAVLAAVDVFGLLAGGEDDHDHGHDHDHDHEGHRHTYLPWIMVIPFVVVFAVGPAPLGAYMAQRQPTTERAVAAADFDEPVVNDGAAGIVPDQAGDAGQSGSGSSPSDGVLPPPVDGAVELNHLDFLGLAAYDDQRRMEDVLVRLEGFVSPDPDGPGDTFLLTRFMLSCCAADGFPVSIQMHGVDPIPPTDTWLEVEGYWIPHTGDTPPPIDAFDVVTAEEVPVPENPYL